MMKKTKIYRDRYWRMVPGDSKIDNFFAGMWITARNLREAQNRAKVQSNVK